MTHTALPAAQHATLCSSAVPVQRTACAGQTATPHTAGCFSVRHVPWYWPVPFSCTPSGRRQAWFMSGPTHDCYCPHHMEMHHHQRHLCPPQHPEQLTHLRVGGIAQGIACLCNADSSSQELPCSWESACSTARECHSLPPGHILSRVTDRRGVPHAQLGHPCPGKHTQQAKPPMLLIIACWACHGCMTQHSIQWLQRSDPHLVPLAGQ